MPKRVTVSEVLLLAGAAEPTAYRWVYAALRAEILEGRLRPGARLPSTRDLASQYKLSRGTIVTGFEQLKAEGYIEGNIGSGSYVSKILPEQLLQVTGPNRAELRAGRKAPAFGDGPRRAPRHLSEYGQRLDIFPPLGLRPSLPFRAYVPSLDLFPTTLSAPIAAGRPRR